jgi:hypothetical protein
VEAKLNNTNISGCSIYGISTWGLKLNRKTIQTNLVITPENEPIITVDNIEIAEFIYLMLNHKKLRDFFNAIGKRGVLILGRFANGGLEVLQAIAARLREMAYLPIIFDFDRPDDRNYTETIKTLTGLSRFVVVDLSGPSVPQELYATVPHFKVPFVPILEKDRHPYSMFADLLENDHVLKPIIEFESQEELIELIPSKIVAPAEKKCKERQILLGQLFESDKQKK